MEVIFSAIVSELASRSISFLVEKYLKQKTTAAASTQEKSKRSLHSILLRVRVIVEEAEGRRITNQAMLHQLSVLRKEMFEGYYILDSFSCRIHGGEEDCRSKHPWRRRQVSHCFAPSKLNAAKRVRLRSCTPSELLEQVFRRLENAIDDARELVVFMNNGCCPRLYRQPYSVYLFLDKSLFNRQMEMDRIISFLLRAEMSHDLGVLPIIGPGRVGKSTLIEHACDDQRVRRHFSRIVCFTEDDLLTDGGIIKHENNGVDSGRTLIIVELVDDIDECSWRRLISAAKMSVATGSRIIISSRSDMIARLGTTEALKVEFFTQEAYWYFFKARLFGSTNADEHPELTAIAMDMAMEMEGCFMSASLLCEPLKANFNPGFWTMALQNLRHYKNKNFSLYRARFLELYHVAEPLYVRRVDDQTSSEYIVILDHYQRSSARSEEEDEAPEISVQILFFGSVKPQGKFKVVGWRSHLPPYYDYMFTCEIRTQLIV